MIKACFDVLMSRKMKFGFEACLPFLICMQIFLCLSCTDEQESCAIDENRIITMAGNIRSQLLERYNSDKLRIEAEIPSFVQAFREDGSWSDINYEGKGMAYWNL